LLGVTVRHSSSQTKESDLPDGLPEKLTQLLKEYHSRDCTPLTLDMMAQSSAAGTLQTRLDAAKFLQSELLVRVARAIRGLNSLLEIFGDAPHLVEVRDHYMRQLVEIEDFGSVETQEDDDRFCDIMSGIKVGGGFIVPAIARDVAKAVENGRLDDEASKNSCSRAIDEFLLTRLGIRMLIGQYVESRHVKGGRISNIIPMEVIQSAVDRAKELCQKRYEIVPEVVLVGEERKFKYVKSHLHHMVFELVKNSMRAVVEYHHIGKGKTTLPSIKVVISHGNEDITVKISDEGGGIRRSDWPRLWLYTFTTDSTIKDGEQEMETYRQHFSGGGYGLPYARLFARYFGGQMTVLSMEGHGTDVYVQLSRLGNRSEVLDVERDNEYEYQGHRLSY
jgi:pyruvate dehydrogenase kinase 2/3/4